MSQKKKSKGNFLFSSLLDGEHIDNLIRIQPSLIVQLFARSAKDLYKIYSGRNILIFLANYHNIVKEHGKSIGNMQSNNLSVHYALLFSFHELRSSRIETAKKILKQCGKFIEASVDIPLTSISLNNLANIYLSEENFVKAASYALKATGPMLNHLKKLEKDKDKKNRAKEDAVILVSLAGIAQKALKFMINKNSSNHLKKIFKMVNDVGFFASRKYLGEKSFLSKQFTISEDSIYLPIFIEINGQQPQKSQFQEKVLTELEEIYRIIQDYRSQPEVYYINQLPVVEKTVSESLIAQNEPQIPQIQQLHIERSETFLINNWETQIQLLKQSFNFGKTKSSHPNDQKFQFVCPTHFVYHQAKRRYSLLLDEDQINKIVALLNIYDVLPYEYQKKSLKSKHFLRHVLCKFINIEEDGNLQLYPRAVPLIDPLQIVFCKINCFIFFNHVRFNQFRIAICPKASEQTIYLDIEFKNRSIYRSQAIREPNNEKILQICSKIYDGEEMGKHLEGIKHKTVSVLKPQNLKNKVISILERFEQSLCDEQQAQSIEFDQLFSTSQSYNFYKYSQFAPNLGRFYFIHHRTNINSMQVFLQDSHETFCVNGKSKAKGNIIYQPLHFIRDFSVGIKSVRSVLGSFCEIIQQKYDLKTFDSPISQQGQDLYSENALMQLQITSKFFRRKFIQFQDYFIPVTVQLLSINNEMPLGIRLTAYDAYRLIQMGHFISVIPIAWQKPIEEDKQGNKTIIHEDGESENTKQLEDYNFKKAYFLAQWMEVEGFDKIFKKIKISPRGIQVHGISGKFSRIQDILQII